MTEKVDDNSGMPFESARRGAIQRGTERSPGPSSIDPQGNCEVNTEKCVNKLSNRGLIGTQLLKRNRSPQKIQSFDFLSTFHRHEVEGIKYPNVLLDT
jgi:hypothetical protein